MLGPEEAAELEVGPTRGLFKVIITFCYVT